MDKSLFTIGIEEEFQIIDPETRELRSHIEEIVEQGKVTLKEHLKPEMHQSVVELSTEVCADIHEARSKVTELRQYLSAIARKSNFRLAAAGTHPFSHWQDQKITNHPRYRMIVDEMQMVARANLIFG